MDDIKRILQNSDKATFLEFINEHLPEAERAIVVLAKADGEGGLLIQGRQLGHAYHYELDGFVQWISKFVNGGGFGGGDEIDEEGYDDEND